MVWASGARVVALKKWAKGCPKVWGKARIIACALAVSGVVVESPNSTLTVVPCNYRYNHNYNYNYNNERTAPRLPKNKHIFIIDCDYT